MKKFQSFLPRKKHLYSFLFSVLCMEVTVAAASVMTTKMVTRLVAHKDLLEEREKLLAENETERMRANLLRAVSHDLRSPLISIINNSSLILDQWTYLADVEKQRLISTICEDSGWLLHMVENLLTVTRICDNDRTLSITTSEEPVEEVVSEALQKLSIRYPDAKIQAQVPEEFILIPMDAILIEQVIINLLTNAILHSQSTRPIELIVCNALQGVVFTVRDYGTGLPPENMEKLFDCKGSGFGLSICKTIITAHHGTLFGKNHAEGAEFTFTLPREAQIYERRPNG